jgi:hypothetical protein
MPPIIKTSTGFSTRSKCTNLSTDWSKMLMPNATRNTPLKKPPSSLTRCHPKDRAFGELLRSEICTLLAACLAPS